MSQIKSKERVAQRGEVFTAEREVNAMLDLVKNELGNPEKKERNDKFLLKQCRRHVGWLHEKIAGGVTKALSPYDGRKMASMAKNSVENEVQAIRINGTIIGGMAGLLFYLAVWAGGIF